LRVAVIGSNGQLGTDLVKAFSGSHEVIPLTHMEIEVADPGSCTRLKDLAPDVVINTAAFHKTDQCEDEPLKAFQINAIGARNVALVCKEIGAIAAFISTDYVFDGRSKLPYVESDPPSPVNAYGISKLAGELFTRQNERHYVFRVASLFGAAGASGKGGNFVEAMVAKARKGETISVIDDIRMSPTYTRDAAAAILALIEKKAPFGTYHVTNSGECSWFEFAAAIFEILGLKVPLGAASSSTYPTKVKRPAYSALSSDKLGRLGIEMPHWKGALRRYLEEKGHLPPLSVA